MLTGVQSQKISLFQYSHLHGQTIFSFRYRYFQYPWGIFWQDFRCAFTSRSPRTAFGFSRLGAQALSTREAKLHKDIIMHRVGLGQCPHAVRLSQDMPGHARSLKENKQTQNCNIWLGFVKKYAGTYNINKSTRRILSENVKLIILSKENNFTITDNFSALFYRYLELDITIGSEKISGTFQY